MTTDAGRLAALDDLEAALASPAHAANAVASLLSEPRKDALLARLRLSVVTDLAESLIAELPAGEGLPPFRARCTAWDLLDLLRRPAIQTRLVAVDLPGWTRRILDLLERSHYTVGPLFRRRAAQYGTRALFEIPYRTGNRTLTWRQTAARVDVLARGLLAMDDGAGPGTIAILSENRIEAALCDLACLTAGLPNVLIPATSTEADVGFMLGHCGARTVLVSGGEQVHKVLARREGLPDLVHIVVLDAGFAAGAGLRSLDGLAARAEDVPSEELERRALAARFGDLATVMYTSGTTGTPKGIRFSHRNIVSKRFMRALALPEIGEQDVFLCYLPLYHTFGRFLELLGCVFWGSVYCFLESPSIEAVVAGMRRFRPTAFISVPKKWMELQGAVGQLAPLDSAGDEELTAAVRHVTSGSLRWGLSAAGHLDSEVFRFFQRYGIELLSGFGMTEATGGITMTPPGGYRDDSLGCALPGIELRLEQDGELLVRGPYVMEGYLEPSGGDVGLDAQGWFHTGDLMEQDEDGFLRLVDRKKEIYKNTKGETIAPQRVENLFRDFESVSRVFLVGDHRDYNTALIWPRRALADEEQQATFRSLVVSVNKFLAPYERIVDFAVVDRELDPERGELTPKGTPRRKAVERAFADRIALLYRRADLRVGAAEITFPNWLFQALGITAQDIQVRPDGLVLPSRGRQLGVKRLLPGRTRVGSAVYAHPPGPVPLGALLTTPRLWLGNDELVGLVPLETGARLRPGRAGRGITWAGTAGSARPDEIAEAAQRVSAALQREELGLLDLHEAARVLGSGDLDAALSAVRLFETMLAGEEGPLAEPARAVLARAADTGPAEVRRLAFRVLAAHERETRFGAILRRFLQGPGLLLDRDTRASLVEQDLSDARLDAFLKAAAEECGRAQASEESDVRAASLLAFLEEYGSAHPTRFRRLRAFFVRTVLSAARPAVLQEAVRALAGLTEGFRQWLGPTMLMAVDPETGREYRWEDVVVFEEGIPADHRQRLLAAVKDTAFLREASFLFFGQTLRLSDVPPAGVWVRPLAERDTAAVYRVTVQTRLLGAFELAATVNRGMTRAEVTDELNWLVLCGEPGEREPLVADVGGYWEGPDVWSEELLPGASLDRALRRQERTEGPDRLKLLWPFVSMRALTAYVDVWNRTGRRWEVVDPGPANVIVPTHDYQSGARIVSLARRPHAGLAAMLSRMHAAFAGPVEETWPALRGMVDQDTLFSAVLEAVGPEEGLRLLRATDLPEVSAYAAKIDGRGFLPSRLFFAAKRYRRWAELTIEPTRSARARTLLELWETYGLQRLLASHPEARVRFFRETVLQHVSPALAAGLEGVNARLRSGELAADQVPDAVADLRAGLALGPDDDYFLARLSYPHLRPEDAAGFVRTVAAGRHQSEVVVTLEDQDGTPYQVRHALSPKEVGRLLRLFLTARLDVRFRPEHQYLVALNERGLLIGGIYYEVEEGGRAAHLEKIVVAERYRKKGVADGLMHEFLNRLRSAGVRTVTTGFFRPEYFYGYGFRIEKRFAGLMKDLAEGTPAPAP
jgi:long-subunit acyl-CoA synthetase (AMP-forming)/GNAT superfamily N-acetyltransferase